MALRTDYRRDSVDFIPDEAGLDGPGQAVRKSINLDVIAATAPGVALTIDGSISGAEAAAAYKLRRLFEFDRRVIRELALRKRLDAEWFPVRAAARQATYLSANTAWLSARATAVATLAGQGIVEGIASAWVFNTRLSADPTYAAAKAAMETALSRLNDQSEISPNRDRINWLQSYNALNQVDDTRD